MFFPVCCRSSAVKMTLPSLFLRLFILLWGGAILRVGSLQKEQLENLWEMFNGA
jgi:hypothetical protein